MSIKFKPDGAVFPTKVKDGKLIIVMGSNELAIPFPFLKDFGDYDNTNFPMSTIMAFLPCETCTVVMRFDGTVTTYLNGDTIYGFTRFNLQDILGEISILEYGSVVERRSRIEKLIPCTVYGIRDSEEFYFECIDDPEPIAFNCHDNLQFIKDLQKGARTLPKLEKVGDNLYQQLNGEYIINGKPIPITGYRML